MVEVSATRHALGRTQRNGSFYDYHDGDVENVAGLMETIHYLRSVLQNTLKSQGRHGEQELFDELTSRKPRLIEIFEVVGPRSQEEQRELQSGRIVINGKPVAVNSDFVQQTLFLAQQLDCSEKYVASILQQVMADNPNLDPVNCIEATVVEFHQRRRHLVDCLRYILDAAEMVKVPNEVPEIPRLYVRLREFVRIDLIPGVLLPGGKEINFGYQVYRHVLNLSLAIGDAFIARKNAGSYTVAPSQGGNPALGYDILNARYQSLNYERRNLAAVYFQIARMGYLSPKEVKASVEFLADDPNNDTSLYILAALLAEFEAIDPSTHSGYVKGNMAKDAATQALMKKKLAPLEEWKDNGMKGVILLRWTLFLAENRHHDPTLEHQEAFKTEELETQIWNAVQGDAFVYLTTVLIQLQKRRGKSSVTSFASHVQVSRDQEARRLIPDDDFQPKLLETFDSLLRSLIQHASSELRKIKSRQEDLLLASSRTDRARIFRASIGHAPSETAPRQDIAMLYSFIGLLYSSLPPDRALQFWGAVPQIEGRRLTYLEQVETTSGRLPGFLQWAVWSTQVRDHDMMMALYDMLAGLSKGQQCSELAHNFMARGLGEIIPGSPVPSAAGPSHYNAGPTISWTVVFGLLDSWASSGTSNPRSAQQKPLTMGNAPPPLHSQGHADAQQQHLTISSKDVLLAQAFLRMLSTVVFYSVPVRIAVTSSSQYRAITTLMSLIPFGIPLELKGSVFEALSAFCEPGAGPHGIEICKSAWTAMEKLEVINVRASSGGITSLPVVPKGVEAELEEVETVHKLYPATIPFLRLLCTLIHTAKRIPTRLQLADMEPLSTIPESLGQPYRLPGIDPFISFVVDNVFANIPNREYIYAPDRWKINDLCLCFVERCLASYDLETLVSSTDNGVLKREQLVPLLLHPGYNIMRRLLTQSPFQATIMSYIVDGVEAFEQNFGDIEPYFRNTLIRVLRIVHRVLEIQDIFLDVLIPILPEFDSASIIGDVHPRSYFTRFDQALSFSPQVIPALAAYVAFPAYPELVLLTIKILSQLSSSSYLPNLLTIVERSADSDRILNGFRRNLDIESLDDVDLAETYAEQVTGAGAPDVAVIEPLDQAIRVAVLDLLIHNTMQDRPYPNIAHFLLFGGSDFRYQIQDPHALGARRTCIHVILELLNAGVPQVRGRGSERDRQIIMQTDPLFVALPGLAERCYRVIHQLCIYPQTSDSTLRYLRTREDFFARHLAAVPTIVPQQTDDPFIEVLYLDGSRITTTVPVLSSFLRLRSTILDLVALDLHVLTNKGYSKGIMELLEILFGSNMPYAEENDDWTRQVMQPFRDVGQSPLRIVDILQSLSFDWSDSLSVTPIELDFLSSLHIHSCVRLDATGCEIVDKSALLSLLASARKALHAQGRISTMTHADQLAAETAYIMESCAIENHRRIVHHAVAAGYDAWRRLFDLTLMKCFNRFPHDRRENMLFDLLHILPSIISSSGLQESTAILLSEATLSSMTKLREDRQQQIMVQSASGNPEAGTLPVERLYGLLRDIVHCILDSDRSELVRGNLYASLINFFHLIGADESKSDLLTLSTSTSLAVSQLLVDTSTTLQPQKSGRALETGSLAVLKSVMGRLVVTISRDAIDGEEVWKTIAFMLLDSLTRLCRTEKSQSVLSTLVRHGSLNNFVRGLKEADLSLQSVLKPDPDDLNPLYVYESKLSLFVRMVQTRAGAERLLEAQVLPVLANCEYIDARPEIDESFMDDDTFLPSAIQRYHQLFMPTLQLIDGMLATLGSKHASATHQALDFLSSHRDTVAILLKNQADQTSLLFMEEAHLIVSLCSSVVSLIQKSDLLSINSGFGGIHAAVLVLAARCLGNSEWTDAIRPHNDSEALEARTYTMGHSSRTKFDLRIQRCYGTLRKAIIEYLGAASDFTEPEITLVLSPMISTPIQERSSHFVATVPTIGDAIESLNEFTNSLSQMLKQISDLTAELSSRDHIRVDNIREVIGVLDDGILEELDIIQKRSLICQEYDRLRSDIQNQVKMLLSTNEMLLLLLWRHLEYYSEGKHLNNFNLKLSTSTRFGSVPDQASFQSEVGQRLLPVLHRMSSLDLTAETAGRDWQSYAGYIETMSRRMRDTAGLHDSME